MDDYSVSSLGESKNEWCARLVNTLTPTIIQGIKSIFLEAWKLCEENTQKDKYLMTFQTFLRRVPEWNSSIIENEKKRIYEISGCSYLEELITCVHIIQLKALSCVRVGQKQKKVDINIPSVDDFIHKIYINVARKLYTTIYLFEKNIPPLETQKRNRELESIIKECILDTVRESVPVENILRAYMDETTENDVEVKIVDEEIPIPVEEQQQAQTLVAQQAAALKTGGQQASAAQTSVQAAQKTEAHKTAAASAQTLAQASAVQQTPVQASAAQTLVQASAAQQQQTTIKSLERPKIQFSDVDNAVDIVGNRTSIDAPKTIERLEQLSLDKQKNIQYGDDEDEPEKLTIGENISLDIFDINDLDKPMNLRGPPILDDIEILT